MKLRSLAAGTAVAFTLLSSTSAFAVFLFAWGVVDGFQRSFLGGIFMAWVFNMVGPSLGNDYMQIPVFHQLMLGGFFFGLVFASVIAVARRIRRWSSTSCCGAARPIRIPSLPVG